MHHRRREEHFFSAIFRPDHSLPEAALVLQRLHCMRPLAVRSQQSPRAQGITRLPGLASMHSPLTQKKCRLTMSLDLLAVVPGKSRGFDRIRIEKPQIHIQYRSRPHIAGDVFDVRLEFLPVGISLMNTCNMQPNDRYGFEGRSRTAVLKSSMLSSSVPENRCARPLAKYMAALPGSTVSARSKSLNAAAYFSAANAVYQVAATPAGKRQR